MPDGFVLGMRVEKMGPEPKRRTGEGGQRGATGMAPGLRGSVRRI